MFYLEDEDAEADRPEIDHPEVAYLEVDYPEIDHPEIDHSEVENPWVEHEVLRKPCALRRGGFGRGRLEMSVTAVFPCVLNADEPRLPIGDIQTIAD
jgi:hypothetical protein